MKLFAIILGLAVLFGYLFIQSGAWEVTHYKGDKEGVEVDKRRHTIQWDRFFTYLKDLPRKLLGKALSPAPATSQK